MFIICHNDKTGKQGRYSSIAITVKMLHETIENLIMLCFREILFCFADAGIQCFRVCASVMILFFFPLKWLFDNWLWTKWETVNEFNHWIARDHVIAYVFLDGWLDGIFWIHKKRAVSKTSCIKNISQKNEIGRHNHRSKYSKRTRWSNSMFKYNSSVIKSFVQHTRFYVHLMLQNKK